MPVISVQFIEGRTYEQKKQIAKEITDVMVRNANVPSESVSIYFHDMKKENMAKGGIMRPEEEALKAEKGK